MVTAEVEMFHNQQGIKDIVILNVFANLDYHDSIKDITNIFFPNQVLRIIHTRIAHQFRQPLPKFQ